MSDTSEQDNVVDINKNIWKDSLWENQADFDGWLEGQEILNDLMEKEAREKNRKELKYDFWKKVINEKDVI